jgi:AcrR family transcriptional regulator
MPVDARTQQPVASPRAERSSAKGVKTRQRIIDAASDLLRTRDPEGVTMVDVAAAAGLSKGSLYYYFSDCDQVLREVVYAELGKIVTAFEHAAAQATSTHDALARITRSFIDLLVQNCALVRYVLGRLHASGIPNSPANQEDELMGRLLQLVSTQLERGKAEGSVRPDVDVRVGGSLVLGLFLAVAAYGVSDADDLRPDELFEQLVNFVGFGVSTSVPAA